jgi:hypothetical protein
VTNPLEPPNPPHDRVRLTPSERARLADLERSLADDLTGGSRPPAGRRVIGRLASRLVGLAPWIALAGVSLLPFAIAESRAAGLVCALSITVALTIWSVTFRARWTRRRASRASRVAPAEEGRAGGHPGG